MEWLGCSVNTDLKGNFKLGVAATKQSRTALSCWSFVFNTELIGLITWVNGSILCKPIQLSMCRHNFNDSLMNARPLGQNLPWSMLHSSHSYYERLLCIPLCKKCCTQIKRGASRWLGSATYTYQQVGQSFNRQPEVLQSSGGNCAVIARKCRNRTPAVLAPLIRGLAAQLSLNHFSSLK